SPRLIRRAKNESSYRDTRPEEPATGSRLATRSLASTVTIQHIHPRPRAAPESAVRTRDKQRCARSFTELARGRILAFAVRRRWSRGNRRGRCSRLSDSRADAHFAGGGLLVRRKSPSS